MIILITDHQVQQHSPELLLLSNACLTLHHLTNYTKALLVRIPTCHVEIIMGNTTERLHVKLLARIRPIKPLGQKVRSAVFFEQATRHHLNTCSLCHQIARIFNPRVPLRVCQFFIPIRRNAVEFKQIMPETRLGITLP